MSYVRDYSFTPPKYAGNAYSKPQSMANFESNIEELEEKSAHEQKRLNHSTLLVSYPSKETEALKGSPIGSAK
jgi:hypothetical protein